MLFTQLNAVIPLCDINTTVSANTELNSVNMGLYDHATFILHVGSTLAFSSAPVITIESGSSDSADSADVTFHYRVNTGSTAGASTGVIYTADATSSALSLASAGDWAGNVVVLEVDGDELRSVASTGETYKWLTLDISDNVTTGRIAAYAILSNPRYAKNDMPVAV